jgi:hypothetical protein
MFETTSAGPEAARADDADDAWSVVMR